MSDFLTDYRDMLGSVVQIATATGADGEGTRIPGVSHPFQCYVDEAGTLVRRPLGQELVPQGAVYCGTVANDGTPFPTDQTHGLPVLTLPDGRTPVVTGVDGVDDQHGVYAYIVRYAK